MDNQAVRVQISREERHLILAGYNAHGPQWGLVVNYVRENSAEGGQLANLYLQRNIAQLRRRVRDAIARDVLRLQDQRQREMRYAARGNPAQRRARVQFPGAHLHPRAAPPAAPQPPPAAPQPPPAAPQPPPAAPQPPQAAPQPPQAAPQPPPAAPQPPQAAPQPPQAAPQPPPAAPQPPQAAPQPPSPPRQQHRNPPRPEHQPPVVGQDLPLPLGEVGRQPLHVIIRQSHIAFHNYIINILPAVTEDFRESMQEFRAYMRLLQGDLPPIQPRQDNQED